MNIHQFVDHIRSSHITLSWQNNMFVSWHLRQTCGCDNDTWTCRNDHLVGGVVTILKTWVRQWEGLSIILVLVL